MSDYILVPLYLLIMLALLLLVFNITPELLYHEKRISSLDPTSRELNMLPILGRRQGERKPTLAQLR